MKIKVQRKQNVNKTLNDGQSKEKRNYFFFLYFNFMRNKKKKKEKCTDHLVFTIDFCIFDFYIRKSNCLPYSTLNASLFYYKYFFLFFPVFFFLIDPHQMKQKAHKYNARHQILTRICVNRAQNENNNSCSRISK